MAHVSHEERAKIRADARKFVRDCLRNADELREACEQSQIRRMSDELRARRAARGDVVVIDWMTGRALSIDEGNVIKFPEGGRHARR